MTGVFVAELGNWKEFLYCFNCSFLEFFLKNFNKHVGIYVWALLYLLVVGLENSSLVLCSNNDFAD